MPARAASSTRSSTPRRNRVWEQGTGRWSRTQAGGHHEAAARDAVAGLSTAPDAVGIVHSGARFTAPTQTAAGINLVFVVLKDPVRAKLDATSDRLEPRAWPLA